MDRGNVYTIACIQIVIPHPPIEIVIPIVSIQEVIALSPIKEIISETVTIEKVTALKPKDCVTSMWRQGRISKGLGLSSARPHHPKGAGRHPGVPGSTRTID